MAIAAALPERPVLSHDPQPVLEVGGEWTGQFSPGQRFLIQADVYYGGEGMAFGYRLPGGYSRYQVIGREVLAGDEGCYLIPVSEGVSHAQAALCEPWACVEAAYAHTPRRAPKPEGAFLSVRGDDDPEAAARASHPGGLDDVVVEGRPSEALATQLLSILRPGAAPVLHFV